MTLALILLLGPKPKPVPFAGTYEVIHIVHNKPVDNSTLPAGAVTWLDLNSAGSWVMRNQQVGFDGTWKFKGKEVLLTTLNGPAGKITPPEVWVLKASPDRSKLVPISPPIMIAQMAMRYDPNIKQKIEKRLAAAKKQ